MSTVFSVSYISSCYLSSLLVLTLFQFCLSNKNLDSVLCIEEERQALLQFKQGLIDEADRLASWVDEDGDCCRWSGIVCNNSTGHVQQIHLRGLDGHCLVHYDDSYAHEYKNISDQRLKEFGGIIPPQLGNLSELHILCLGNFRYNFESTSMVNMQWISSLRMLHHLDVRGVDLSKSIDWLQVPDLLFHSFPFLLNFWVSVSVGGRGCDVCAVCAAAFGIGYRTRKSEKDD
ncbi:leucine-rich repeat protein [Artemisia annua]|uniref:Leucine-rich repeat protein n=1 Tax=Artemisia annua TaxID=35608 RepID=A0A2U1NTD2_ARTAN|nr:leucine-rich repeat protein [Artemisia annua]